MITKRIWYVCFPKTINVASSNVYIKLLYNKIYIIKLLKTNFYEYNIQLFILSNIYECINNTTVNNTVLIILYT